MLQIILLQDFCPLNIKTTQCPGGFRLNAFYTCRQWPLSSVPKLAVVERFNCNLSAVARLDLLEEANHERRRLELLGGSGGMLYLKILKYRVSEIAFSAFGEY